MQGNAVQFLAKSSLLQKLAIRMGENYMAVANLCMILRAVPNLVEFELSQERTQMATPTVYTKELLGDLVLITPNSLPPNLRALSIVGEVVAGPVAFTTMVRSGNAKSEDIHYPTVQP
ncbi:hypothetical protein HWV62_24626 [Athelia sp. TMB]|nr:hypothetical protein HWV62_24626 [Athelia sp. TMB]